MIRVWIVDDEIWVCQLIRKIIDWEKLGFTIIGESYDGYEALEKLERERPQLVLTDIRMPGYDGVELLRRAQQKGLEAQFIIISGHSDFGYAQEALKYGALGYILKPIDEEELVFFLQKIREKIADTENEESRKLELEYRLSTSLQQLKEQYFLRLMDGEFAVADEEEPGRTCGCQFARGAFVVLVYQLDKKIGWGRANEVNKVMLSSLSRFVEGVFDGLCFENFALYRGQRIVQVLNYPQDRQQETERRVMGLRKRINDEQKLEIGYELTIGVGTTVERVQELQRSYNAAQESVRMRILTGLGKVIDGGRRRYAVTEVEAVFPPDEQKIVSCAAGSCDVEALMEVSRRIFARIAGNGEASPLLVVDAAREVAELFFDAVKREFPSGEVPQEWRTALGEMENCYQVSQVEECLEYIFRSAKERSELGARSRNSRVIEIAKQYIANHYNEDITLKHLADEVCLNPKYFGELFKRETGMNFGDYLTRHRIEVAQALLKDVRSRVNEVGYMVGYKDPKYFSRLFKKMTGVSPQQYRRLFS